MAGVRQPRVVHFVPALFGPRGIFGGAERYALELARQGWGSTHPNPMVGAVIVEDGRIVAEGPPEDIAIHAQEIIKARERIARTISRETGRPFDSVLEDIERDRWLSAEEAIEYGLVGRIINHKTDIRK